MYNVFDGSFLLPAVCTSALCFTGFAFYRLFLHPLAKFPGPKLAALTRYYEAYYDVMRNGQYTFKIAELHKEYGIVTDVSSILYFPFSTTCLQHHQGPIVRISPYELHVSDSSFYEKLYRQDGRWNKYNWSYDAFGAPSSAICTTDHGLHKRRRAPLNTYFSKVNVANRQAVILNRVQKLQARIDGFAASKSALNLGAALSATMTDVATEYILGKSYNNLDRTDFNQNLMNMLQGSGGMWRATKHIRFLGPMLKAMPLSMLERIGDQDVKAFVAFLKVSFFFFYK